ncbi:MAG: CDP-archaeol synthase [Gammaproteobacteria bacterium]|nr:CDP-archaeol synthase [Gammaproteobacteria bacterium]
MITEIHIKILLLIIIANGAPIIARLIFRSHFDDPLDFGLTFFDKRPIFGPSKTIRGVFVAVMVTPVAAHFMDINWFTGFVIGLYAMFGDLFSSFIKRRKRYESSEMAIGMDQIPESLFPLLAVQANLGFGTIDILIIVGIFFVVELVLSRILYMVHIRLHPY